MTLVPASSGQGVPLGLTGATAATRFVGATTTGIPTTGTFAVGDYVVAQTEGRVYVCTVAGSPGTWVDPGGVDRISAAMGFKSVTSTPTVLTASTAPSTQNVYCMLVPTIAGMTYTGVAVWVGTAGAGTPPTNIFVGLASSSNIGAKGTMLAQSGDLAASAVFTTSGYGLLAFSAPYVETATAVRAIVFLQNGNWSVTQHTMKNTSIAAVTTAGQLAPAYNGGTAQTALPANGNQMAANATTTNANQYWAALY